MNVNQLLREQSRSLSDIPEGAPPRRWDWALVVFCLLILAFEVVVSSIEGVGEERWELVRLGVSVPTVLALPWRRQHAIVLALSTTLLQLCGDVLAWSFDAEFSILSGGGLAALVLFYAMYRWPSLDQALLASGALILLVAGSFVVQTTTVSDAIFSSLFWLILVAFALAMRYRAKLKQTEQLQIRLNERHDLARELHDTVAHHVSAIAVQAQAAQFVAKINPEASLEAMKSVEELANKTINEMRHMVGILRSDSGDTRSVAAANLSSFAEPNGSPSIVIENDLDLEDLSSPVSAAIYRVTQESITNARRHSRGVRTITVSANKHDRHIELVVNNDGSPTTRNSGSGYGQIGMQERIAALEGTFESGPGPAAGWRVKVTIPLRGNA